MDFDELNRILELVHEHGLTEFELERDDFKIRIRKGDRHAVSPVPEVVGPSAGAPAVAPPGPVGPPLEASDPVPEEGVDLAVLKSPIVGTLYRASEPGSSPFTEVGETVKKGQVLCIIEAMKLMNEINSDVDGQVMKIYVENGESVQYGERLFAIKPFNV
jgi:acetyl-CoA carboxylase biotin carboxyl carrier protein